MTKQTSKEQLLKDIRTERRRLEKNLSLLSTEDMTQTGVMGTWSVKDILAHLVAWEKLFLDWYSTGVQGGSPATMPVGMCRRTIDALNQQIYEKNRLGNRTYRIPARAIIDYSNRLDTSI